ncbi:MAG: integrase [Burkholderiaceae bacterium]|nr:MAG: integrase [Burkholderiaceae bacterium]TBR76095.1 MAG: integrase [Burkholderiaceae bacterium]
MNKLQYERMAALKESARALVLAHGQTRRDGKAASKRTIDNTLEVAAAACGRLWALGMELRDISSLEERHLRALIRDWYSTGKEPKTIQNDVSRLRQICRWIGKPHLIPAREGAAHFMPEVDPGVFSVNPLAQRSKSWSENGLNVVEKIKEADAIDRRFGAMLRLGLAFGLRKKEQLRIVPTKADAVVQLLIRDNIGKSGKDRDIPIVHPFQRAMLEHAKGVAGFGRPLSWPRSTFEQNRNRYSYNMKKLGVSGRDSDCVGHGLRAEFAENMAMLQGLLPPTLGGTADQMGEAERKAIQMNVSEAMGHHRINVTGAYYGSFRARQVLERKGEDYLEYRGFKARVQTDLKTDRLNAVLAGDGQDILFDAETLADLRAQFHAIVEKLGSAVS